METCAICTGTPFQSNNYDSDLRTLRLDNRYALDEHCERLQPVPDTIQIAGRMWPGYEITTCKQCRGDFIKLLWAWANGENLNIRGTLNDRVVHSTMVAGEQRRLDQPLIPIREEGRTVYLTREEWNKRRGH